MSILVILFPLWMIDLQMEIWYYLLINKKIGMFWSPQNCVYQYSRLSKDQYWGKGTGLCDWLLLLINPVRVTLLLFMKTKEQCLDHWIISTYTVRKIKCPHYHMWEVSKEPSSWSPLESFTVFILVYRKSLGEMQASYGKH